ncbi:TPA: G5 domain-containing protein [Streptococcus suis]|nr:G5 domain-containing protein [Streptococcus suis]
MHKFFYEQRRAFSFRKLTIGLVSLCVGTSLLFGIQSQEVSASTVSPSQIRFEYVLEAELSAEERQLIQSSLPAELKEEATYFVVYRPSKKVLPATGELAGSGLAVLGLGFLVLAVSATKSKKARVLTMLYVTTSGLVLPVLEVGAVQSSALAAYNQTLTIRPGDSLPDGKLRLDGYEFVGYFIEEKSEVKSQARDEKTSLSTSNQLEEPKTNPETAEVDKQISTGEVSGKPDQESQPIVEQADKAEETGQTEQAEETGQTEQADKTEQTGKAEESQDQAAQSTEAAVEEKLITTIPTEAPIHLLPTIDFQVQDKVEEIALEIPEEQIETNQLPLGQSRVEAGQAGSLRISYQEVLVDGQVVARKETSREEIPSIPRKVYIGTGQVAQEEVAETKPSEEPVHPTEEPVEEKLITTIPTEAPIHHLPTIDFQVRDKVEEIALEIPEEQIETEELAIGQRRVEEGQAGSLRISYQEVLVDGQIVARNEISREEIPSIPKRTYIGTRRDEKYVAPEKLELPRAIIRTQEEEIAFERKEVLRADWPPGKVEVVAGKNGKRLHTYAVIEGVETLLKTEVLEQAEAEITYKGVNRPETTTEEIVIDFTERVISDAEQYTDYRQIEVTGEQGLKRLHKENGQLVNEEIVKPAKEQVVRVGTKPIEGQVEKESLRTIDFARRYESNDQLEYGQTRTKQPGQSGQEKVISAYQTIKGVEGQLLSSRTVSVSPVQDEIIEVGTKPQIRIEQEEPVTEYVPAPDKERNVQTVLQEGHAKETIYRTVYNLDTNSGQVMPIQLPGTVSHPGQVRRISVGTKPTITKKALPFTEETIPNSTLYVGERVIVRPGRAGEEITTVHYTLNPRTGETSASQPQIQEIAAVTQVVQVGTKAVDRTVETVDSRDIAFKTEYRADSTLPYPQREELQVGSNGVERITTTRRYVRDQEVGEPTRVNEVVKVVQNRIIKVGTKPAVRRVETDFTRVYEADSNRSLNERHVKQSGIKQETTYTKNYVLNTETGTVTEQAETSQVTRSARQEIVQVGTRPTTETTSRVLPTRYEADITRAYGQQYISQQGRPEITTYTTTYRVDPRTGSTQGVRDTGRVTDSGQEQIIQVGTQPVERTERIELPEIRRQNANLAKDTETVIYAGSPTIRLYRTSYTVNPDTGQLTALQEVLVSEIAGRAREVEIGAKEPEQPVTPPVENEGSCPIVPDNTDGGTCEAPTEPAEKPSSTDSGTTIVPEPEQPNISETEPVSPKKPEETTEETVEDVNKPLLRVRDNKNHYQLFTKERSTKVFYALENKQENFNKGTARLYVNKELIKTVDFTKEKLEARFGKLLPNVDYRIETEMEYRASDGTVKTAKLEDIVSVDFEERHFEIKNIDEAEVWKNENGKLVRKVALKVDPIDVQNYFIKLKSDEHKDIFLQVKDIDEIRINGERHFKLQAKFTNPEERRQKLDKYHDTVTVYLPREVRENRETRNKYSTFTSLLNAMKTNSSGTFELQQDLTASEVVLSDTDKSYLAGHFYGTLRGNGFTIHDLKVPLFDDLRGTVSDLNLKAVDIHLPKEAEVGALAKQSDNATVSNVHAQGRINAKDKIGGIIGESFKTNMKNISFRGELASVTNESNNLIGGIAGWLGGGKIEKGYVDATISSASSNVKAGGLVGQLENDNTRITSSFATGTIISTKNKDTEVGGLVGAVLQGNNIRIADSIAAVKAVNGHKVYGENQQGDTIFSNIKIVEALSTGEDNPNIGFATPEDVKAIVEDRGLIKSHSSLNVFNEKNVFDIDYTKEGFTRTDRKQAYENMEKLLPFFTRDVIIQHANRLESSDSLVTKKLVDVVLMIDKAPVFDIVQNKDRINRLLLHFEDGTVEKHYLVKKKELGSGAVVEYHLLDKNISYTPENYIRNTDIGSMIVELQTQLAAVRFDSNEVNKVLGLPAYQPEKERQLLFLEESFERVKSNISTHLTDLISNYNLVGLDNSAIREYLKSYISKNKVQLLLGLAYMDKWYNIQFGDVNAKNLMMKKADFFGKNVNSLDQLIRIGSMGSEMLKPKNNYALASQVIAKESIGGDLFDYLEGYRKAFAPDKTTNDWFRTTTKATIIETPSTIKEVLAKQTNPTKDIYKNGFYDKLASNHWMYKEMALILLAMPSKDIFILTDMANTLIGTYAKLSGSDTDKENRLKQIAKEWAGHADYLYNILPEGHKEKMFRRVVTWDNKKINGSWKNSTTPSYYDLKVPAMKHFYIPLGHKHDYTATGAHADYTIDNIYYFEHEATSDDGARVYTHEMTHVADDDTILLGHGKRTSLDYEVYARGLFESITWGDQDRLGLNTIYDFSPNEQQRYGRRLTNLSPERFKSSKDLQDYMKGYLDVIYTLDLLEAEAVLATPNSYAKQNWFNQLETQDRNSTAVKQANRTPATLDQLIDSGMVSKRSYGLGAVTTENAYLVVNSFNPLYGSLNNDGTSRNEYEVRKIAFELLAEYGYENGMVPYLSNQYQAELGKSGTEYGRIRDDELISKITASTYSNSAAFRKAMFEKRRQDLEKLKSVTLIGTGIQNGEGYFYGGTRTVSASELRQLMQEAVEHDANNNKYYSSNGHDVREQSRVYSLKAAILNGYLRETNDFRESIYKDTP